MKQLIAILLLTLTLFAIEYKIGDTIDPINIKDQFEKDHNITKLPKTIVIAFEKESSNLFNDYMKNKNGDFLQQHDIVFIADISQMPSFVTTTFAMPKMRTYSYPVLLINEENRAFKFPCKEDKLTIIKTKNNTVQSIDFVSNLKELESSLK